MSSILTSNFKATSFRLSRWVPQESGGWGTARYIIAAALGKGKAPLRGLLPSFLRCFRPYLLSPLQ